MSFELDAKQLARERAGGRPACRPGERRDDGGCASSSRQGGPERARRDRALPAASRLDTRYAAETPEGIALLLRPAGLVPRFYAYSVDVLIRFVFFSVAFVFLTMLGRLGQGLAMVLFFLLEWLYPVAFELARSGATPASGCSA
jgi:hypothetical protein